MQSTRTCRAEIPRTEWPQSLPHQSEAMFMLISVGNSSIHWALCDGPSVNTNCALRLAWVSPLFDLEAVTEDKVNAFGQNISNKAKSLFFDDGKATLESAVSCAKKRASHLMTAYFLTTNQSAAETVHYCIQGLPFRAYQFEPNDFFSAEQGRYGTMGVDRLAAVRASVALFGCPALVIDGGTSSTYTGVSKEGRLIGGGITNGVLAKCKAIVKNIKSTAITTNSLHDTILEMVQKEEAFPIMAEDTVSAIAASILTEVTLWGKTAIEHFFNREGHSRVSAQVSGGSSSEDGGQKDHPPPLLITGGDHTILEKVLQPDTPYLPDYPPSKFDYKIVVNPTLVLSGMLDVINQVMAKEEDPTFSLESKIERMMIGKRVLLPEREIGGDAKAPQIGTILLKLNDDRFTVQLDTGVNHQLTLRQIHKGLILYHEHGEMPLRPEPKQQETVEEIEVSQMSADEDSSEKQKRQDASLETAKRMKDVFDDVDEVLVVATRPAASTSTSAAAASTSSATARGNEASTKATETMQFNAAKKKNETLLAKRPSPFQAEEQKKMPAKRRKTPAKKKISPKRSDPKSYVGSRIAKFFDDELFFGSVTGYDGTFWAIFYDDGDSEEYHKADLEEALRVYKQNKKLDRR